MSAANEIMLLLRTDFCKFPYSFWLYVMKFVLSKMFSAKKLVVCRNLHDQPLKSQIRDNGIWLQD